jgi:putative transposase
MQIPVRKHTRLPDFDYSNPGAYLVTICTHNRQNIFGSIRDNKVEQSQLGHVIEISWQNMPSFFDITLDEYVVMPNHFHAILWINDRSITTKASQLIAIIQTFKSLATKRIHKIQKSTKTVIWQRSFYESIIRDEVHLNTAREYIKTNPIKWQSDLEFLE